MEKGEQEFYKITEDVIKNAYTYVKIADKRDFVNEVAVKCFDAMEISASVDGNNINGLDIPTMYKENSYKKSKYLMSALVRMYLGYNVETEQGDAWLMTDEEYDKWSCGHIMNQIERYKSNAECRDICFDLLQDYRDLEKRLNVEIYGMLNVMNDTVARLLSSISATTSKEYMEKQVEELEKLKESIANRKTEIYDE